MSDMSLDETSLAIGRLQASHEGTAKDVAELKAKAESMDEKLDKLLARSNTTRLTMKHWATLLGLSSLGGGGLAHMLRKLVE